MIERKIEGRKKERTRMQTKEYDRLHAFVFKINTSVTYIISYIIKRT